MVRPVIALLTDFGSQDHYAGVMKGVILGICPDVTLVDISHDLPPHDITFAAHELAATYRYFPPGTIFLVVVDPGVGTARRGLAAEAGERRFVAPDNGVLTAVFQEAPPKAVVELTERQYARPTVSRTFEGRDRFAPAAAWLAKGVRLGALGRPVDDYRRLDIPAPRLDEGAVAGEVLLVDRFGNLISNVDRRTFDRLTPGATLEIQVDGRPVPYLVSTYGDIPAGAGGGEGLGVGGGARIEIRRRGGAARSVLGSPAVRSPARGAGVAPPPDLIRHFVQPARTGFLLAMINFDLTDEHRLLEQSVREWGAREIAPRIKDLDREHRFDRDILPQMASLGLLGI